MIPKIIHYCWFGGKELPIEVKKCIASWRKMCDEITDSQKAKKKLDQTKKLLDTLGVGKSLEKGVNKLDDHLQEATGLKGEVISAMQDLEKVYRQLDQI